MKNAKFSYDNVPRALSYVPLICILKISKLYKNSIEFVAVKLP